MIIIAEMFFLPDYPLTGRVVSASANLHGSVVIPTSSAEERDEIEMKMSKPLRVLMVEDSEVDVLLTILALNKGGYEPTYERVEDAEAMRKALREKTWDVVLCDYQMPKFNSLAAIALLKEIAIDIPLIIVSVRSARKRRWSACDRAPMTTS